MYVCVMYVCVHACMCMHVLYNFFAILHVSIQHLPRYSNQDRLGSGTGEKPGGLGERSATAIKSELNLIEDADKVEVPSIEPPPMSVAEATPTYIFLQTTVYLLDAHALKFAEMSLAHGLTSLKGDHGNSHAYLMAEARLLMYRQQHEDALKCIKQAIVVNIQVRKYIVLVL